MKIVGLDVALPKTKISNGEMIGRVKATEGVKKKLEKLLAVAGFNYRYHFGDEDVQSAFLDSFDRATKSINTEDISTIIFYSVDTPAHEPSGAAICANILGDRLSENVRAFDVKAACGGWIEACRIAQSLIRTSGESELIALIGIENNTRHGGPVFPNSYTITDEDAHIKMAALTMSDSVAVTVLEPNDEPFLFAYRSDFTLAKECAIPAYRSWGISGIGDSQFFCDGAKLTPAGTRALREVVSVLVGQNEMTAFRCPPVDRCYTHGYSKSGIANILSPFKFLDDHINPCDKVGNLITNSLPYAIYTSPPKESDVCMVLMTAAGLSVTGALFTAL